MRKLWFKNLHYSLSFRHKDTEEKYFRSKFSQQKAILFVTSVFVVIYTAATWIINPKDRQISEPDFFAYRAAFIVLVIIFNLIQHFRPSYGNYILFSFSFICFFSLGEISNKNMDNIVISMVLSTGMYMEISILILIIARIGIIKNLIFIGGVNFLCFFRYIPFYENYQTKFYPLIHFIFNTILLCCLSYAIEKIDRERFYHDKRNEFSLNCFKELVKDVFPNPIVIVQGEKVLFANKQALKIFKCQNNEEVLKRLNKMSIDASHDEFHSSYENLLEQKIDESISVSKKELKIEDLAEEIRIFSAKKKQTLSQFLKKNDKTTNSKFSYYKILRGILNWGESSSSPLYYDIKIKNLIWEDKSANLVIFTENKTFIEIKQLREQSEYKDSLLATVSHDLRTPLNGIIGMLNESIKQIHDKILKKNLTVAYRSALYLLSMINDILDYHQISNGKLRLSFEYFCLWSLIQDVSKLIKFQAKLKGLTFIKENKIVGLNKKAFIRSDPNRLRQVILNLLGNALKFTPSGSITISIEEDEQDSEGDYRCGSYLIKVKDTGIGIKEEDQAKLFTLFGRLDSTKKDYNKNGVGLGLVISQNMVKILNNNMRNGDIKVISKVGEGSCFYFPLFSVIDKEFEENFNSYISEPEINEIYRNNIKNSSPAVNIAEENPDLSLKTVKTLKVLLVDDDQINIIVASSYLNCLETVKYEVAIDGLQAVEKIKSNASKNEYYNIVLMDCNMPIMNGFEATKLIKEMVQLKYIPDIYIIACTANASITDIEDCFLVGMNDYIAKPFSKEDLIAKLKKYT